MQVLRCFSDRAVLTSTVPPVRFSSGGPPVTPVVYRPPLVTRSLLSVRSLFSRLLHATPLFCVLYLSPSFLFVLFPLLPSFVRPVLLPVRSGIPPHCFGVPLHLYVDPHISHQQRTRVEGRRGSLPPFVVYCSVCGRGLRSILFAVFPAPPIFFRVYDSEVLWFGGPLFGSGLL